jgi:DNA-binding MarR family transcriptional regulator
MAQIGIVGKRLQPQNLAGVIGIDYDRHQGPPESPRAFPEGFVRGFTCVPNWVFTVPGIRARDHHIYVVLRSWAYGLPDGKNGVSCYPSVGTIARRAGVSVRTVHNSLKSLEEAGCIYRVSRAAGQTKLVIFVTNRDAYLRDRQCVSDAYAQEQDRARHSKALDLQARQHKGDISPEQFRAELEALGMHDPAYSLKPEKR